MQIDKCIVTLSRSAAIAIKEILDEPTIRNLGQNVGIRIYVVRGRAGDSYNLTFSNPDDGDTTVIMDGIKIHIDSDSLQRLGDKGVLVDYVMGHSGVGFKFIAR